MKNYTDEDTLDMMKNFGGFDKCPFGKVGTKEHEIMSDIMNGKLNFESEEIIFDRKKIFDKFSIMLPENAVMTSDSSEEKDYVEYEFDEGNILFELERYDNEIKFYGIDEFIDFFTSEMTKEDEELEFVSIGSKIIKAKEIGYFDFIVEEEIYCYTFVLSIKEQMYVGKIFIQDKYEDCCIPMAQGITNTLYVE